MKKERVAIIALGCPKALVDAEQIMARLADDGYEIAFDPEECDTLFINTCSFLESSRNESYEVIENAVELKKEKRIKKIVVTGCLPQMLGEKLKEKFPQVDSWLGTGINDMATAAVKEKIFKASVKDSAQGSLLPRLQLTLPHVAYLRVAEGCSHACSFCTIPSIRGPYHSFPLENLVAEAAALAQNGTRELIVIAQDTSIVGLDLDYDLPKLLGELSKIDGIDWIRVQYLNPMHLNQKIIDGFKTPKVLPYFDIPIQHVSAKILENMGRPKPGRDEILSLIQTIRTEFPDSTIRTSLITGFPGETTTEFEELKTFISQAKFDRLGAFPFSPEPGTKAKEMDYPPVGIAELRSQEILEIEQGIVFEANKTKMIEKAFHAFIKHEGPWVKERFLLAA
ncbi:MAG: 30S ribosomal protein S12 methylthiotransferase RimO [Caldiserica bacterium]|nr:30S ribosomal protein S12 methylthiotransferase RimO [Caldisericota bacterium]